MPRPVEVRKGSSFVLLASAAIIIAGLYFASEILIPVALAILLSFLLTPAVQWLERIHMPRALATIIVMLLGMGLLGCVGYVATRQLTSIVENSENYRSQFHAKLKNFGRPGIISKVQHEAAAAANSTAPPQTQATVSHSAGPGTSENPVMVKNVPTTETTWAIVRDYASKVLSPLATAVIVLVLVFFMLMSREDLRDRVIRLLGHGRINLTTQALDEASTRISSYLGALAIVNACYAVCVAFGLFVIGKLLGHGQAFPSVLVWGILVGVLRFVPYVGIWIGAGIPLILAFALFPDNAVFFATLAMFLALEVAVAQFIEPMWYGSTTGMSALAVLVSAIFWTWLWGPVGLLLSTPMTVILVVMGKYVPQLKFLEILLREEPPLEPHFRMYQRLISMDQEEAADIARDYLKETKSLEAVYDELFIPALSMAEHDWHHERVEEEQLQFVRQSVRDLVDELAEDNRKIMESNGPGDSNGAKKSAPDAVAKKNTPETPAKKPDGEAATAERPRLPDGCTINVACIPARDEADEIVAAMLKRLLESRGYCAVTPTAAVLVGEMVDFIESKQIDIACISAMPPAAVAHARYLCKRLQERYSKVGLIVGLWTFKSDLIRAADRIACSASTRTVTTLHDAQQKVDELAQPLMVRTILSAPDGHEAPIGTSPASHLAAV